MIFWISAIDSKYEKKALMSLNYAKQLTIRTQVHTHSRTHIEARKVLLIAKVSLIVSEHGNEKKMSHICILISRRKYELSPSLLQTYLYYAVM